MKTIIPSRLLAIVVAAAAAFAFSMVWYSPLLFGGIWEQAQGAEATAMPPWKFFVVPLREVVTASFLAWLLAELGICRWQEAATVGLILWAAFYVVQLSGAVIFDGMSPWLGAVHAGDWLGKMLLMSVVLSVLPARRPTTA